MKKQIIFYCINISFIFFNGCAALYKPINPLLINYSGHSLQDEIELSYEPNIMMKSGNTKYSRKADKKGIFIVSIKLTNHTNNTINVGRDIAFFSAENKIFPLEPMTIKNAIRQKPSANLFYLLLLPVNIYKVNESSTDIIPIGLVVGPGLAAINILEARTANKELEKDLLEYNILNREIKKGETVYGIIGVRGMLFHKLSAALIKK